MPLLNIWPHNSTIVSHHPIEFTLHVSGSRPHCASARITLNLRKQLAQKGMTAGFPGIKCLIHFVGLADTVDSLLYFPKMLGGDIVTCATKFTLEADARWIKF
jgi:hypothetical protein